MTNKAEVCGWQPKGNSEDIPKPPKFNTNKLSVEKLKERCDRYEKALTEIDCSRYGMQFRRDRNPNVARQALAAIEKGENNEI